MSTIVDISTIAADCADINSVFSSTNTTADFGDSGGHGGTIWLPFVVNIPRGAVIQSAILKIICGGSHAGDTCKIKVGCEAADNPAAPTTSGDLVGRTLTAAYLQDDAVAHQTAGTEYDYDVTTAVAEIIARTGWAWGNTLAVLFKNNGSSGDANRTIAMYDHLTYTEPILEITYVVPMYPKVYVI
jgi:hypothetical protein